MISLVAFGGVGCDNMTSAVALVPRVNDSCSNDCKGSDSDPFYWCGVNREDRTGKVVRCVEHTVKGGYCVSGCEKKEKSYYWCMTNAVQLSDGAWMSRCSLEGYTTNNQQCLDRCARRGEDYYYCHTSKEEKDKMDYCSPRGMVRPVQYTINGMLCISPCEKKGEKYTWCYKSQDYCKHGDKGSGCDSMWDYCSQDEHITMYGDSCRDTCTSNGEDYYWCYLQDDTWDYCSTAPRLGVDASQGIELTIYGRRCITPCKQAGGGYYWCRQLGRNTRSYWDYCSPNNKTVYMERSV